MNLDQGENIQDLERLTILLGRFTGGFLLVIGILAWAAKWIEMIYPAVGAGICFVFWRFFRKRLQAALAEPTSSPA